MHRLSLICLLVLPGCEDASPPDDKGDGFGAIALSTPQTCAVLKLANLAAADELAIAVDLDPIVADAIVAQRRGSDGIDRTADDARFEQLGALDFVPYVGPHALDAMLEYIGNGLYACGEQDAQILAFNDFHGALQPPSGSAGTVQIGADEITAGGVEFFATHLALLRADAADSIVVSAGDLIGATPLLSALFHDQPTVLAMNALGLDDAGVGNHELDRGRDELLRMQSGGCSPVDGCGDAGEFVGAQFDFLAANIEDDRTDAPVLPPYAIHWIGNARVAVIALTLADAPQIVSPDGVRGLEFHDEIDTLDDAVRTLQARGIEAFVVLLHQAGGHSGSYDGCEDLQGPVRELTLRMPKAVDIVVAGHTDGPFLCEVGDVVVTSAASNGRMITDIDITIDELGGDIAEAKPRQIIVTRDVARDRDQSSLLQLFGDLAAPLANRVVGSISGDLPATPDAAGASPLGFVIADAQLSATLVDDYGGAELAFTNPGGVRADLVYAPAGAEAVGEVTYGEIFAVQPFGNNLVTMTLTGAQIVAILEQQWQSDDSGGETVRILSPSSGFHYAWDPEAPIGARIVPGSLSFDGEPIAGDDEFRVTVNAFLAGGGDGFTTFTAGADTRGGMLDLQALEAYIADRSPIAVPTTTRIERQ